MADFPKITKTTSFIQPDKDQVAPMKLPEGFEFVGYLQYQGASKQNLNRQYAMFGIIFAGGFLILPGLEVLTPAAMPLILPVFSLSLVAGCIYIIYLKLSGSESVTLITPEKEETYEYTYLTRPKLHENLKYDRFGFRPSLKVNGEEMGFIQSRTIKISEDFSEKYRFRVWMKKELPFAERDEYMKILSIHFCLNNHRH